VVWRPFTTRIRSRSSFLQLYAPSLNLSTAPGIGACTDDANCDGGNSPPNIDDALTFLDYRFGGIEEGHIALVYLSGPKNGKSTERETIIDLADAERWEQARAWLLECRPDENVYCSVAVFKDGTSRKKGNIALLLSLPVENDDYPLPDDLPPWSYRVETSPGRYQTYYDLAEPITNVETYQRYTAALADHTPGMGHQAIDAARLLRLPGFPNVWRAGAIVDVVYGSGEPYCLEVFEAILAPDTCIGPIPASGQRSGRGRNDHHPAHER